MWWQMSYEGLKEKYYTRKEIKIASRFGTDDFYEYLRNGFYNEENEELYRELYAVVVAYTFRFINYGFGEKDFKDVSRYEINLGPFVDDVVHDVVVHMFEYAFPRYLKKTDYETAVPAVRVAFLKTAIKNAMKDSLRKIKKTGRVKNPDYDADNPESGPEYLYDMSVEYIEAGGYRNLRKPSDLDLFEIQENGYRDEPSGSILTGEIEEPYAFCTYDTPFREKWQANEHIILMMKKLFALPCRKPENLVACGWIITQNMLREMMEKNTHANSKTAAAAAALEGTKIGQALDEIGKRLEILGIPVQILDPLIEKADMEMVFHFDKDGAQDLSKQLSKTRKRLLKAAEKENGNGENEDD